MERSKLCGTLNFHVRCAVSPMVARISAVISITRCDDVVVCRARPRAIEQLRSLASDPEVNEITNLEVARHLRGEVSCVFDDVRLKIDRRGMLEAISFCRLAPLPRPSDGGGQHSRCATIPPSASR